MSTTTPQTKISRVAHMGFLLALLTGGAAQAGQFTVSPVRVLLHDRARTEMLSVTNHTARPLTVQVRALDWRQDEKGVESLSPSTGLVVFPSLIELAPGGTRRVRVGVVDPAGAQERSFRIQVTELPDGSPNAPGAISMRLQVSLPVFHTPHGARAAVSLSPLRVEAGVATLLMQNDGAVHVRPDSMVLTAHGPSGPRTLHPSAWYVLPGARRALSVALPPEDCARLTHLDFAAAVANSVLRAQATGPFDCGPSEP